LPQLVASQLITRQQIAPIDGYSDLPLLSIRAGSEICKSTAGLKGKCIVFILGWFDAHEAKLFGKSLAQDFMVRMPLSVNQKEKIFEAKAKSTLVLLSQNIQVFKRQHKLNIYKKAKMGNSFKWTLTEAGYEDRYVNELTEWLMIQF
jgi:hypothetical protein